MDSGEEWVGAGEGGGGGNICKIGVALEAIVEKGHPFSPSDLHVSKGVPNKRGAVALPTVIAPQNVRVLLPRYIRGAGPAIPGAFYLTGHRGESVQCGTIGVQQLTVTKSQGVPRGTLHTPTTHTGELPTSVKQKRSRAGCATPPSVQGESCEGGMGGHGGEIGAAENSSGGTGGERSGLPTGRGFKTRESPPRGFQASIYHCAKVYIVSEDFAATYRPL